MQFGRCILGEVGPGVAKEAGVVKDNRYSGFASKMTDKIKWSTIKAFCVVDFGVGEDEVGQRVAPTQLRKNKPMPHMVKFPQYVTACNPGGADAVADGGEDKEGQGAEDEEYEGL